MKLTKNDPQTSKLQGQQFQQKSQTCIEQDIEKHQISSKQMFIPQRLRFLILQTPFHKSLIEVLITPMIDDAASDQSNQSLIERLHQASCLREVNHDVHRVDHLVGHQVSSEGIFRDFIVDEMIA